MSTRQDYITALGDLVQGDFPLGESAKIIAINSAIKEHSRHKPRIVPEDEAGTGGFDYALTLLSHWAEGVSVIKSVEYPVDDTNETADILQDDAWCIYHKPSGKVLRFLEDVPAATETLRVTYTALHICTDAECTIATFDEEAVQCLAAGYFCNMLATYYAQNQDSTIKADSVDHKSKSSDYAARARTYRKTYFSHMGIEEGKTTAASVTKDQDIAGGWGGDRLTHPRKGR